MGSDFSVRPHDVEGLFLVDSTATIIVISSIVVVALGIRGAFTSDYTRICEVCLQMIVELTGN